LLYNFKTILLNYDLELNVTKTSKHEYFYSLKLDSVEITTDRLFFLRSFMSENILRIGRTTWISIRYTPLYHHFTILFEFLLLLFVSGRPVLFICPMSFMCDPCGKQIVFTKTPYGRLTSHFVLTTHVHHTY